MLTDDEILDALKAAGIPRERPWARDVGPYDVTEPTYDTKKLVAEIERRVVERIAKGLEAEADNSPCAEDASVHRGAAWLVRADFSYEEADRLQTEAEAVPATPA